MAIITISRQFGAGGYTLGKDIAGKPGYTFASDEVISMIARKARVSKGWVQSTEKEAGSKKQRILSSVIPRSFIDRIIDDQQGYIDEEIYLELLEQIIRQIASDDNCLILGRGGQYILKDSENAFHRVNPAGK
jgi:Cytidylate kinase-like family